MCKMVAVKNYQAAACDLVGFLNGVRDCFFCFPRGAGVEGWQMGLSPRKDLIPPLALTGTATNREFSHSRKLNKDKSSTNFAGLMVEECGRSCNSSNVRCQCGCDGRAGQYMKSKRLCFSRLRFGVFPVTTYSLTKTYVIMS